MMVAGLFGCTTVLASARTGSCTVGHHPPLEIAQLIAVKQRFESYRADPGQPLVLSGGELAMLIEDEADVPVFIDVDGTSVHGQVALPAVGGCWPVRFSGTLFVDDRTAHFTPDDLSVGLLGLTFALTGGIDLRPENMPSARIASLLRQTKHAEIIDGAVHVHLLDPDGFRYR